MVSHRRDHHWSPPPSASACLHVRALSPPVTRGWPGSVQCPVSSEPPGQVTRNLCPEPGWLSLSLSRVTSSVSLSFLHHSLSLSFLARIQKMNSKIININALFMNGISSGAKLLLFSLPYSVRYLCCCLVNFVMNASCVMQHQEKFSDANFSGRRLMMSLNARSCC